MQYADGILLAAGLDGGNTIMFRISTLGPKSRQRHLAFYRIDGNIISIARILDGRQDYLHILFGIDRLPETGTME